MQSFQYTKYKNRNETVVAFLAKKFPYRNSDGWLKQINDGRILLNGESVKPNTLLNSRDVISYITLREEEPEVDSSFEALYEDEWLLGISKSGNIPVTRSGRYVYNNLLCMVKERLHVDELYAVQRLDRETSGVLVFAKTKPAATKMSELIAAYRHRKIYHAVLKGCPTQSTYFVDAPIEKCPEKTTIRIRQMVVPTGKSAQTRFTVLFHTDTLTLAKIETYTGRTHQIRCHADYVGLPIVGDKLYGATDREFLSYIKKENTYDLPDTGAISRQLLHATELRFEHPFNQKEIRLYSDYFPHFSRFKKIGDFLKIST